MYTGVGGEGYNMHARYVYKYTLIYRGGSNPAGFCTKLIESM